MNKILVPTDFSPNALKALNYAAEISRVSGASICIVHVMDISEAVMNETIIMQGKPDQKLMTDAKHQLHLLSESTKQTTGNAVEEKLVTGLLTDGIIEATRECHADMIIMGTLGDSAIQEKIFGSITAKMIGKAAIPLLAVPLLYEWETPTSILLAINETTMSPSYFRPLTWFASQFDAAIHVTIFSHESDAQAVDFLQRKKDVELFCANMKHDNPGLQIEGQPLYGDNFEDAIKSYVKENKISLLALMNHKRNFLESLFHRSITKKMSYHTDIPLLALPLD